MPYAQLLPANPAQQDWAGSCLSFVTHSFSVPNLYGSAWDAWCNSIQHGDRNFPDGVAHPIWFEHWGTYGDPPTFKNWGHTCVRFSDGRILSSPGSGFGQQWFNSIEQVESWFNCRFVGWSEDVNGVKVIQYSEPEIPGVDEMFAKVQYASGAAFLWNMATGQLGWIDSDSDYVKLNANLKTYLFDGEAEFTAFKNKYPFLLPTSDMSNVEINVDAIAAAIAGKLDMKCDCGCGVPAPGPDVTTKAEILTAIEINYPGDK